MSERPPCPAAPRTPVSTAAQLSSPMARSRPAGSPAPGSRCPRGGRGGRGAGGPGWGFPGASLFAAGLLPSPLLPGFPCAVEGRGMGSFGPDSRAIAGAGSPRGRDWDPDSRGRRPQGQSSHKARRECASRELGVKGLSGHRPGLRSRPSARFPWARERGGTRHPGYVLD